MSPQAALSLNFFLYDTVKIVILIFLVVFSISFLRTFLISGKLTKLMKTSRFGVGHLAASVFGAITPFCSCSSIPIFIGFLKARIPLGIAFAYLITSPLVNEVAFVMMGGLFGWKVAVTYAISGILLGVLAGMVLGALKLEKHIILNQDGRDLSKAALPKELSDKIKFALKEAKKTLRKLLPYVIAGVGLGAIVHGYVPQEYFESYIGTLGFFAVPIAVLLGVPLYAGSSTVAPLIFSISASGVPLGTALAFMMSISGLSLPEGIILKRVMDLKLLSIFFGIVALGIVSIGYLFNGLF